MHRCNAPQTRLAVRVLATLALCLGLVLPCAAQAEDWLHTVRPGDTFWSICEELTTEKLCWMKLPEYNEKVEQERRLSPGSQVKIPVEWLKAPPVPADVEFVRGQAFVERPSKDRKRVQPGSALNEGETYLQTRSTDTSRQALVAGQQLYMGDKIITMQGAVLLRFADGSTFLIKADSELVLERLSSHGQTGMVDTHMRLNRGSGRAKIESRDGKSRYRISTPAAIAAARGTEFSISASENAQGKGSILRNEVLEGTVSVSGSGTEQMVKQGFGTIAEEGKPPAPPVKLLPAPILTLPEQIELPFTLEWAAVAGAQAYSVDVYSDGKLLESHRTEREALFFPALQAGHYEFVVRAVDQLGLKGLEANAATVANLGLLSPTLSPETIKVDEEQVNISWPAVEYAQAYRVQIADTPAFDNLLIDQELTDTELRTSLPAGQSYYARVQAIYPNYGPSSFSAVQPFTSKTHELWLLILQGLGMLAVFLL